MGKLELCSIFLGALHLRGSLPHVPHLGLPGQNSHCFKAFQARRCSLRCCQTFLGHHVCPYLLVWPRFCPSRAAGENTDFGGWTLQFLFICLCFSPLCWWLDGRVNNWLLLVSGVGPCHWELQHPLGETRSPLGRLPPASLAYVRLDHVPGATLASYWIFGWKLCTHIYLLI